MEKDTNRNRLRMRSWRKMPVGKTENENGERYQLEKTENEIMEKDTGRKRLRMRKMRNRLVRRPRIREWREWR
jgi:hypothetical protein